MCNQSVPLGHGQKSLHLLAGFTAVLLSSVAIAENVIVFEDDFNRADATAVGNDWIPSLYGELELQGGRVVNPTTDRTPRYSGISQRMNLGYPITISAILTEGSGFGGLPRAYISSVGILGDGMNLSPPNPEGLVGTGYMVQFNRSDINFANSEVRLLDNQIEIARTPASFQYGEEIHVEATFYEDGSVEGLVSGDGSTFPFQFGSREVQSSGDYIFVSLRSSDIRQIQQNQLIFPSVDDVVIATISVDPIVAIGDLVAEVFDLNLQQGISNSLDAKLQNVIGALDDANTNNDGAALNSMYAFCNAVEAQRGNKLTESQADQIISSANEIIGVLDEFASLCE